MNSPVNQLEVDCVASFAESCGEMEAEPFFSRDEKLSLTTGTNKNTYYLGDRFHFRSALISFRRIWMESESANWKKTVSILKKSSLPTELTIIYPHDADQVTKIMEGASHLFGFNERADRTIDLWLNTVFAHDGLKGKNKRSEFEAIAEKHGHALFEYNFRLFVKQIGFHFINLNRTGAKPALNFYKEKFNLSPSFKIGAAFGVKRREKTADGHIIIRQGSTEHYREESMEDRFTRILDRHENGNIKSIIGNLVCSRGELLRLVIKHSEFRRIVESIDGAIEVEAPNADAKFHHREGLRFLGSIPFAYSHQPLWIVDENIIITSYEGVKGLDFALGVLKKQLLDT